MRAFARILSVATSSLALLACGTDVVFSPSISGGAGGGTSTGGGGGSIETPVLDPNLPGPYATATVDDTFKVSSTGHGVAIHCVYPTSGPTTGPYPVVVFGHGFQAQPAWYNAYVERLASFGYVALTVDFPAPFSGNKHTDNARDLAAGLDWAAQNPTVQPLANTALAGASGHSLGGKVSFLAATYDDRIRAAITLDPVDSAFFCSPADCPDVSDLMATLAIPTGVIGETTDATGQFMACAPAADNFTTFYAGSNSPALKVDVLGANHLSFLDPNPNISLCNPATAKAEAVAALSKSMLVAFYERHLRGIVGYDTHLTGEEAYARYVETGLATIESK